MDKTILIAGKDIPVGSDFASAIAVKGRTTIITAAAEEQTEPLTENGYTAIPWNRASALSARALILSCLNLTQHIDEAVFIFDEAQLATAFNRTTITDYVHIIDELIIGYQYLVAETIARFEQKTHTEESTTNKLVFLYKSNPSQSDAVANPALRASANLSSPLVAAAAAAFKAFAENTAALHTESTALYPILIACDAATEVAHKDNSLANWLCDYLDSVDELKKRPAAKQLVSWIKAGAKKAGGFGLF